MESNSTVEIPQHHVRKEVCTTRPAYRQGRELRSVKVYTINHESKHILIHGLQAVGAGSELKTMCERFGEVDEMKPLDDYPADEFTEVYWVKFKRTQSARFAKKHLDDTSVFGGVLHVCYAPEYETVADTRDKLQERRRVIAAKTRPTGPKSHTQQLSQSLAVVGAEGHNESSAESPESITDKQSTQRPPPPQNPGIDLGEKIAQNLGVSVVATTNYSNKHTDVYITNTTQRDINGIMNQQFRLQQEVTTPGNVTSFHTFAIPPPPITIPPHQLHQRQTRRHDYGFARVPSANATFPPGFDGRLNPPVISPGPMRANSVDKRPRSNADRPLNIGDVTKEWNTMYEYKPGVSLVNDAVIKGSEFCSVGNAMVNTDVTETTETLRGVDGRNDDGDRMEPKLKSTTKTVAVEKRSVEDKIYAKMEKKIIRDYKPKTSSTPRFVPRQVVQAQESQAEIDGVDAALKVNAFQLQKTLGPVLPADFEKSEIKTSLDDSLQKTVKEVRSKLKQITQPTEDMPPIKKAKIDNAKS